MNGAYQQTIASLSLALVTRAKLHNNRMSGGAYLSNKQHARIEKLAGELLADRNWKKAFLDLANNDEDCIAMYAICILLSRKAVSKKQKDAFIERAINYAVNGGLDGMMVYPMLTENGVNMLDSKLPNYRGRG